MGSVDMEETSLMEEEEEGWGEPLITAAPVLCETQQPVRSPAHDVWLYANGKYIKIKNNQHNLH